jgi:hypothetical protein
MGGSYVGEYANAVAAATDGRGVVLSVRVDGFPQTDLIFYLTNGCSGAPYVEARRGLIASSGEGPPGRTIYLAAANARAATFNFMSHWDGTRCETAGAPYKIDGLPAVNSGIDLNRFVPPFSIILK